VSKTTPTPATGVLLGNRYRVESELGRGGMGVVYACFDEPLARRVAVKTLSVGLLGRDREARMRRFQREVQALSQLDHGGILHIYDAGEADDPVIGWVLYYAMELIEGETLSERLIRGGAMERGQACAVVAKCAEALGNAHQRGIVHRDVKPANIFLAGRSRVVVADFGVCKIEGGTEITRKDQMVGTPSYLAPEQILGLPVDPRTDVFALGALLYVLVTNTALRPQLDRAGLSRLAGTDDAANRGRAMKNVMEGLPEVVARALARDPKDRYAGGAELAEALAPFATRVPDPGEGHSDNVPVPELVGGGTLSAFTHGSTAPGEVSNPALRVPSEAAAEAVGGDTIAESGEPGSMSDDEPLPAEAGNANAAVAAAVSEGEETEHLRTVRPALEASGMMAPVKGEVSRSNPARPPLAPSRSSLAQVPISPPAGPDELTDPTQEAKAPRFPLADRLRAIPLPARVAAGFLGALLLIVLLAVALRPHDDKVPAPETQPRVATPPPVKQPEPPRPPDVCLKRAATTPNYREVQGLMEKAAAMDKRGDVKKSLPLWEKALALDPQEWQAHRGIARAMKKAGQAEKARVHFQCITVIRPGTAEADEAAAELKK
jgi:serine/threonine-protein kinase